MPKQLTTVSAGIIFSTPSPSRTLTLLEPQSGCVDHRSNAKLIHFIQQSRPMNANGLGRKRSFISTTITSRPLCASSKATSQPTRPPPSITTFSPTAWSARSMCRWRSWSDRFPATMASLVRHRWQSPRLRD